MWLRSSLGVCRSFVLTSVCATLLAVVRCQAPEYEVLREPDPALRATLAARFVDERLDHWQRRLDLRSWRVRVVLSSRAELRPGTLGNIRWDARKRRAVMRVLRPDEYNVPNHAMLADMEFTVVHELLHLELSSLPRSEASRSDEEHTINRLTASLLKLDRGY